MKIVVPTDFSSLSKDGAIYAAHLAKRLDAEVILLHVCHAEVPVLAQTFSISDEIEKNIHERAFEHCLELEKECRSAVIDSKISYRVIDGYPIEEKIEEYCIENQIDLIVMGTKDVSRFESAILGNISFAIMNASSIPVLSIPENCHYEEAIAKLKMR